MSGEPEPAKFVTCKVGQITEIKNLEGTSKLFVGDVDIGDGNTKHFVTNVRKFYSLNDMKDRRVCVFVNSTPTEIHGEISECMLIGCGPNEDSIELIEPQLDEDVGALIYFGPYTEDEVEELDQRNKYWRKMLNDLEIDGNGEASYKGEGVYTNYGPIIAPTFRNVPFQ